MSACVYLYACLACICVHVCVCAYVHIATSVTFACMRCVRKCICACMCICIAFTYVPTCIYIQNISYFSFDKASKGTVMFSRDIEAEDLIQMPDGASGESSGYVKHEQSVFVDKILQKSQGKMKIKLNFGDLQDDDLSNDDDVDTSFDFGKEFESNGTYLIEKAYCKKRDRRSAIFSDLNTPSITKATLLATIDTC